MPTRSPRYSAPTTTIHSPLASQHGYTLTPEQLSAWRLSHFTVHEYVAEAINV
jgi:hypothetical protein